MAGAGLRFSIDRDLPLAEVGEARRLPESRATAGKVLLLPRPERSGAGRQAGAAPPEYAATPGTPPARRGVFGVVAGGNLRFSIDRDLPPAEAGEARRLPESRATTGKVLLLPPA